MNHKAPIKNDTLLREAYEAGRIHALMEQTNASGGIPMTRNTQLDIQYVPRPEDFNSPEMYPGESVQAYLRRILGWNFGRHGIPTRRPWWDQ